MPVTIDTSGVEALAGRLAGAARDVRGAVAVALESAMADLAESIAETSLSGHVLNARTGRLRASLAVQSSGDGGDPSATISSDVPYAAIHEYGGVIERVARHQASQSRRLRPATAYTITEPERSYLRSGLAVQADAIAAALVQAVMEILDT